MVRRWMLLLYYVSQAGTQGDLKEIRKCYFITVDKAALKIQADKIQYLVPKKLRPHNFSFKTNRKKPPRTQNCKLFEVKNSSNITDVNI